MEHSLWVEKYRPTDLSTYIGNEHLKDKVKIYFSCVFVLWVVTTSNKVVGCL